MQARVDFIPYQYRPVLKFIKADLPRLLIADSVGVGKTIEAGLILRELQARSEINSVLIICPRPLVAEQKWQREMKRFDENLNIWMERYCNTVSRRCIWMVNGPNGIRRRFFRIHLLNKTLLFGPGEARKKRLEKDYWI